jgi:hypothetical protein
MKILVLGLPRSRSNFVTAAFAEFYGVPNLMEPYWHLRDIQNYSSFVDMYTKELLKTPNFVCKLQSSNVSGDALNGYAQFQFGMYDSIYITARKNIVDQIASLLVAKTNDAWAHYPKEPLSIVFDWDKDEQLLREIEIDIKKLIILKNQLAQDNIHVRTLYYEISEEWVKTHLNDPKPELEKSDYDYKKIISNYNELEDVVSRHFEKLELL